MTGPSAPRRRAARSGSAPRAGAWLCAVLAACGPADDAGEAANIAGAPLAIDPDPIVAVGVVEGDTIQEFDRVAAPFLLPDGRLAVPVRGARAIRLFDAGGGFAGSLGRAGNGPGEFRELLHAWPRGDTIEALDFRLRRITRFLPDGTTEDVRLQSDLPDLSAAIGPAGDGWIVAGVAEGAAGRRDSIEVRRIGRDGVDGGLIATAEGMVRYRTDFLSGPEPLAPHGVVAVGGGRAFVADAMVPAIDVFDVQGRFVAGHRWPVDPVPAADVLPAVIDSAAALAAPDRAEALRRHLEAAPAPAHLPVLRRVLVDDEGFLWIQPFDPFQHAYALGGRAGTGGTWIILAPDGRQAGTVDVPADLEPHHITADAVVAIARDELGVETVRVHPLRRR